MTDIVLIEKQNGIATVTLNRPEALNALSVAMRQAIADAFHALQADDQVRVIILTGNGRAFTAGLDLKELGQTGMGTKDSRSETINVAEAMRDVGKPIIAAINGFAVTGGFEIALACDILIASTEARFADTHVRMGVVPGWGLSQRLARLVGASRAKQLSFTGNYLDAETACRWGLVNEVLPPDELLPYCRKSRTISVLLIQQRSKKSIALSTMDGNTLYQKASSKSPGRPAMQTGELKIGRAHV